MIYYRLIQHHQGWAEGSTITEDKFKGIGYLSKPYFEPLDDFMIKDMIEYDNPVYCIENGIDKMLFYNQQELDKFLKTSDELAID